MLDTDEIARLEWETEMQRQVDSRKPWRTFWYWFAIFGFVAIIIGACLL